MDTHEFRLLLNRYPDEGDTLDALYEAGCDDASFGKTNGVPFADLDREAETFADALFTAIGDVESIVGLEVIGIEPAELVTATDIAERFDVTREAVRLWIKGDRNGGFPTPVSSERDHAALWRWTDVLIWRGQATAEELHRAHVIAHHHAAIQNRRALPDVDDDRLAAVREARHRWMQAQESADLAVDAFFEHGVNTTPTRMRKAVSWLENANTQRDAYYEALSEAGLSSG